RLRPGALGGSDVARKILGFPGEALPHRMPRHLVAEHRQRVSLGGVPRTLDELDDADPMATAQHAQRQAEGRRGFTLAGRGVDDEQPFFYGLGGDLGILNGFALRHLGAMTFGFVLVDAPGHDVSFTTSGNPATMRTTRLARAASR